MSDIRKNLEQIAETIEKLEKRNAQPVAAPLPVIKDRSLSGNAITGGTIEQFTSTGIKDSAKTQVLEVEKDGIRVPTVYADRVGNDLVVQGDLDVKGDVTAEKLHVKHLTADNRNDSAYPILFDISEGAKQNGLAWTGSTHTKQFKFRENPDRLWSSETLDLHQGKELQINGQTVLAEDSLGVGVLHSNLRSVGTLKRLEVLGDVNFDNFVSYSAESEKFSIGTEFPSGMLSLGSLDHQFVVDPTESGDWKLGTWTTSSLDIITDDTTRISIDTGGSITVKGKTVFEKTVGINVRNFQDDVDLAVGGAVRFQNKKQEVGDAAPRSGIYRQGDIVWNTMPRPTAYIGWVCIQEGNPGIWKPFGQISS